MIVFGPLLVLTAIAFFCWLLFALAVFALPLFVALTVGVWAFHTGAGALGAVIFGLIAGGGFYALGQIALAFVMSTGLRLMIILLFVVPASIAGYNATLGIAQMAMPSAIWQIAFSLIGAVATSVTALLRFTGIAPPGPSPRDFAGG